MLERLIEHAPRGSDCRLAAERQLAELIQNISNAARQQAVSAGHVSNTMNVIQEITAQTVSATEQTATSIGKLAAMAVEMRESVEGFKLPDQRSAR